MYIYALSTVFTCYTCTHVDPRLMATSLARRKPIISDPSPRNPLARARLDSSRRATMIKPRTMASGRGKGGGERVRMGGMHAKSAKPMSYSDAVIVNLNIG